MLTVDAVSKRFGGVRAVSELSFEVARGSITSVIGPNGAGKTTLFNVISGLVKPSGGRVLLGGKEVTGWSPHRLVDAGMGRTFQNVQLFPALNVVENVMTGRICRTKSTLIESVLTLPRHRAERRESRRLAEQLLQELGIYERRYSMPGSLPYGDQRRVEVARALATNPQILMLDEPLAGMTHREALEFVELVMQLNEQGMTVFCIEHNMVQVMRMSQRIVVMNFGTKIAEGRPAEIQDNAAVLEAYLGTRT
jgi:branched-chain amino acid transport system ATP-binding protein